MVDDAYLKGHPEFVAMVAEAKEALRRRTARDRRMECVGLHLDASWTE